MKRFSVKMSIGSALLLAAGMTALTGVSSSSSMEPRADRILRESCDALKKADSFSFHADITYDQLDAPGGRLQFSGALETVVRRPDSLRASYRGDIDESTAWYDGRTFTLLDDREKLYASAEVPGGIDSLLEYTAAELGFTLPLADLMYSDPYPGLRKDVSYGFYAGLDSVVGRDCHHLSFSQDEIDWQIWIDQSSPPVPRKLTITYKNLPGAPQYTAIFSEWDLGPSPEGGLFIFTPPAESDRIEFMPPRSQSHDDEGVRK